MQRGPFKPEEMQNWFQGGYFDSALRISNDGNKYITLGLQFLNRNLRDNTYLCKFGR